MLPAKRFYMIRHGQTEANAARIMAGSIDSPLTAHGIKQAKDARDVIALLEQKPAAIFHSHLSRARDTALVINEALGVEMHEDERLAELHAGELEGAPYEKCEELFESWPRVLNGEDPNDFFKRVKAGKNAALESGNEPVLIVCHGGVMRAFGEIHNVKTPGRFENAHLYEFIPNLEQPHFPWTVFDYRLCDKTRTLIQSKSSIYDAFLDRKIAS